MSDELIHHQVDRAAARDPDRLAVVDDERALTYGQLARESDRVAALLRGLGVGRGDRVGLHLDKSAAAVVGLYGCLKAGAAYVPLDPDAPRERLAFIARDCRLRHLITAGAKAGAAATLAASLPGATLLSLDRLPETAPETAPSGPRDGRADDLAYVLYTSGSTGRPKGVALSHRNALAFVRWAVDAFGVTGEDRLANHAPLHFDLSVFDLFAASRAGAAVVLVSRETAVFPYALAQLVAEREVTVWYSVPSALVRLVTGGALERVELPRLRLVLFAGEVFPLRHLRRLTELLPGRRFANLFGPTETNVCTWYELPDPLPPDLDALPIGRAIDGVEAFAVADTGTVAGPGETGELYVAGPTVMQGYWGDAERTARALVPDPRGRGGTAYRTGDFVQPLPDGNLRFLGRRDAQVKTRGFRVELGEIEAVLCEHPAVTECAAVAVPDDEVTNRLEAVVATSEPVSEQELLRFCRERLPEYMVPALRLAADLPRTSTGKLDRQRLAAAAGAS